MSEPQNSGCNLWAILIVLVVAISVIGYNGSAVAVLEALPLPRHVSVSIDPQEAELPFTLRDSQIIYTYEALPLNPCNLIIQGRILDSAGQAVTNVRVTVQIIEYEVTPIAPQSFYPEQRYSNDPSLWVMLMPTDSVPYLIWLTDEGGQTISPTIFVSPPDCNHNVATLIFDENQAS